MSNLSQFEERAGTPKCKYVMGLAAVASKNLLDAAHGDTYMNLDDLKKRAYFQGATTLDNDEILALLAVIEAADAMRNHVGHGMTIAEAVTAFDALRAKLEQQT
jgi:hypothetical protein